MQPVISVIIPTFNRAHIVESAIESILNQNCDGVEVILVDDASTDSTESLMEKFQFVNYIRLSENGGVSKARNYGVTSANGDYIQFLDSDDRLEGEYLRSAIEIISHDSPDLIAMPFARGLSFDFESRCQPAKFSGIEDYYAVKSDGCFINMAWIWKRDYFLKSGGFREDMPSGEDEEMIFRAIASHPKISFGRQGAYFYRDSETDRLSHIDQRKLHSLMLMVREITKHFVRSGVDAAVSREYYLREIYRLARSASREPDISLFEQVWEEYRRSGGRGHRGSFAHDVLASMIGLRKKERISMKVCALRKKVKRV